MIISKIIGGIGNQLFQFAAARALSLEKKQNLSIDIRSFANYKKHSGYIIDNFFAVKPKIATPEEIHSLLKFRSSQGVLRILSFIGSRYLCGKKLILEKNIHLKKNIDFFTVPCYLYGYWQSEIYFKKYEKIIRKDFKFKKKLSLQNKQVANFISTSNSIGIHVRRGDYLLSKILNTCDKDYYLGAANFLASLINKPNFFIFSDDPYWARSNIKLKFPSEFIDWNTGINSTFDMHLFSLCKHQIISNSTFSWWGAWLNDNNLKKIIAPKKWFLDGRDDQYICPSSWIRM